MSTSCIIVAGGSSQRMGSDKRRLRLWGECGPLLLEHMAARATRVSDDVIVVLNDPEAWSGLPTRLVCDEVEQGGPLAGIAAGLAACHHEYALVLACDIPLVQEALINALLTYPRPYDALMPLRPDNGARAPRNRLAAEPLLAVYRRTCLPTIRACLARGARALVDPLELLDTRYLTPDVWRQYDPQGLSFVNVNRPDDVARVKTIITADNRGR